MFADNQTSTKLSMLWRVAVIGRTHCHDFFIIQVCLNVSCRMVKSILGQIESKRARELELPDPSAPLSAVNTARPSSNPSNANH